MSDENERWCVIEGCGLRAKEEDVTCSCHGWEALAYTIGVWRPLEKKLMLHEARAVASSVSAEIRSDTRYTSVPHDVPSETISMLRRRWMGEHAAMPRSSMGPTRSPVAAESLDPFHLELLRLEKRRVLAYEMNVLAHIPKEMMSQTKRSFILESWMALLINRPV